MGSWVCHFEEHRDEKSFLYPEGFLPSVEMTSKYLCITRVFREQLLHSQLSPKHALLVGEPDQILHVVVVFLKPLVEGVLAEKLSLLF
jgi:hypothetical protein